MSEPQKSEPQKSEPQNGRGALFAGGLAAILASACCLGPLVLIALGFSGAWMSNLAALEPYRPIFLGAALIAMSLPTAASSGLRKHASLAMYALPHKPRRRTKSSFGLWLR